MKKIEHPDYLFHGQHGKGPFFEGWYFKLLNADNYGLVIIPGVFYNIENDHHHAFIMVADSIKKKSYYKEYSLSTFYSELNRFQVEIDGNVFSDNFIELNLLIDDFRMVGKVEFSELIRWKNTFLKAGAMSWYSYMPFMECYHDVISMNHNIEGSLKLNSTNIDFKQGLGYIEKDWGKRFPENWIWLQCNNFLSKQNASIMISIATVPWLWSEFVGLLAALVINNEFYLFSTYNNTKIKVIETKKLGFVGIVLFNKDYLLKVVAKSASQKPLKLYAPDKNKMKLKVDEYLDTKVKVTLTNSSKTIIYESVGMNGGLEMVGDMQKLIKKAMR